MFISVAIADIVSPVMLLQGGLCASPKPKTFMMGRSGFTISRVPAP